MLINSPIFPALTEDFSKNTGTCMTMQLKMTEHEVVHKVNIFSQNTNHVACALQCWAMSSKAI